MPTPLHDFRPALRLLGRRPRCTTALILATGLTFGAGALVSRRPEAGGGVHAGRTAITAGAVLVLGFTLPASFLLAWAVARERELALQVAFGATPGHLFRQSLAAGVLVVGPGAGLGLAGAALVHPLLAAPVGTAPSLPDAAVLGGVAAWAACSTLLTGLLPALFASRIGPAAAMRTELPGGDLACPAREWQQSLAVVQSAAVAILLAAAVAGLMRASAGSAPAIAGVGRAESLLFGLTALLALGLAGFCGYGLTGQGVNHRRTELALRAAFGATRRQLLTSLLWAHARPVCSGAVFGLLISWLGEQLLSAGAARFSLSGLWACLGAGAAAIGTHQAAGFLPVRRVALRAETERPGFQA